MNISKLITELQAIKKQEGDLEVLLSSDPEGNNFGDIDPRYSYGVEDKYFILYPVNNVDIEE